MSELALQRIAQEKRERTGKLDLRYCGLTDFPPELFELEWLEELTISNEYLNFQQRIEKSANKGEPNCITATLLPQGFANFPQLKTLRIGARWGKGRWTLRDISVLEKLTSLTAVDLVGCAIGDLSPLSHLSSLVELNLSGNQISDLTPLSHLSSLRGVDLSGNQISDFTPLSELSSLTALILNGNQISDFTPLSDLSSLTMLGLYGSQISDLTPLSELSSLTALILNGNQISDLTPLSHQPLLTTLYLGSNQISDLTPLSHLPSLTMLDLDRNQISDLTPLSHLPSLTMLFLGSNQISDLSPLSHLPSLTRLDLDRNQISDLTPLSELSSLTALNLSSNPIGDLSPLLNLPSLTMLDLRANQISDISGLLPLLKKGMQVDLEEYGTYGKNSISLYGNPLSTPPITTVEKGTDAILAYFAQLEKEGTEALYEARVVIVGEPGAGKTTLFRKLMDKAIAVPDPGQGSTHGININQECAFAHWDKEGVTIKAAIWDFGGQDIQNYLHQYFYVKDNLFVLVCDHRAENTPFDYWFEMISRLCKNSHVLVVCNQKGRASASQSLSLDVYRKRFPEIRVTSIDVDLKDSNNQWLDLTRTIAKILSGMERVNQEVLKSWKPVRERMQQLKAAGEHRIHLDEYQSICRQCGILEEDIQNDCLDYLCWLGYVLHYDGKDGNRDHALSNTVFIDPMWITTGLYEILRNDSYRSGSMGRFQRSDIESIWKNTATKCYSPEDRNNLLALLLKDRFDVCYQVDDTDAYIVPILISHERNEPEDAVKPTGVPYTTRFKFPFMPFGLFSRLTVRLYKHIWGDYVWRMGVWLKDEKGCIARLEHTNDRQEGGELFSVSLYGEKADRIQLLAKIRTEIKAICSALFPNLVYGEQIPCPCRFCENMDVPDYHDVASLYVKWHNRKDKSQCRNGEDTSIYLLLDSIFDPEEIRMQERERMGRDRVNVHVENRFENIGNPHVNMNINNEFHDSVQVFLAEAGTLKRAIHESVQSGNIPPQDAELAKESIEEAEEDFKLADKAHKDNAPIPPPVKRRLKKFFESVSDETSVLHKTLKLTGKGLDVAAKLLGVYGAFAKILG
jgi:internalin A